MSYRGSNRLKSMSHQSFDAVAVIVVDNLERLLVLCLGELRQPME